MTYRQLLAAIAEAERRKIEYDDARDSYPQTEVRRSARGNKIRIPPPAEEQDRAQSLIHQADSALDEEIDWESIY